MKKLEQCQLVFRCEVDSGAGLPVRVVGNPSQSVIPSQECREQREKAAGLEDRWVWRTRGVTMEVADPEEHECHVQREEEREEGDCRAQGAEQ